MGAVIGEILPLALGIAISPIPIIAAILILLSPKARVTSVGFLLVTVFTVLSTILPGQDADASRPVQGIVQILLGALLLVLALGQWRKRPRPDVEPELPKWMQTIDRTTFPVAFGLGFLLSALNPKNLIMAAATGVEIGSAGLGLGAAAAVIAVFTIIAASTVLLPVTGYLLATDRFRGPLNGLRAWLAKENAVIMAILLLVIGIVMIGKGIGNL
jgi:threonine/homoserine/homoserine lactone efflux protein